MTLSDRDAPPGAIALCRALRGERSAIEIAFRSVRPSVTLELKSVDPVLSCCC